MDLSCERSNLSFQNQRLRNSLSNRGESYPAGAGFSSTELQEKVDAFEKEFSSLIDMVTKLAAPLARAVVILQPSIPDTPEWREECDWLRSILTELQKTDPTNRTIVIFIGRLFKAVGNLDGAVKALKDVIQKRAKAGEDNGKDQGDLYFNLACYLNLSADQETDPVAQETLREQAWDAVKASIKRWPPNWKEAQNDGELKKTLPSQTRRWNDIEPATKAAKP
jgi:hypothetical protein